MVTSDCRSVTESAETDGEHGRAALFEAVFRDSPDGIIVVDAASGSVIDCNAAVRRYLGYEPERLVGEAFDDLFADALAGGLSLIERVRLHGAVVEERELRRIDGSGCPMHLRTAIGRWDQRAVIIVTLRDVRERRRAEAARRSAEDKYRRIFEQAVEGIFQTTPDGRYVSANPALARIYGYDTPEALMAHLTDIAGQLYVDPARRTDFRRLLDDSDVVRDFESQIFRRDGTVTWISENARAVRDTTGTLRHYEGTVVDVSERKHAEEARRSEAEVARALARAGRELMSSIDSPQIFDCLCALTAEVLACEWANAWMWDAKQEAYVQVASGGRQPGAATAKVSRAGFANLLSRLEPDEVAVVDATTAEALGSALQDLQREFGSALYFAIRRGGVCVGVLMAVYRRGSQPFTSAQERIARGIAHLSSLALEHARVLDELARASRVKSEFVATISHELRTPLNIIIGYNDLLRDDSFGSVNDDQADILDRIGRTARELSELISATLDLSKLENGALRVDLGAVSVAELVDQIAIETRDLAEAKPDLAMQWRLGPDLPLIHTDPTKLKIILKNLVNNAIKFTERGNVTITAASRLNGVEFGVADTGVGIAPEALSYVFEAFRQGDGSMTRRHGGVGLGLHLVQRFTELLEGTVTVQSTVGAGSTFRVWLPLRT